MNRASVLSALCCLSSAALAQDDRLVVRGDDVEVTRSCTVVFEKTPIEDGGRPGVLQVVGEGVTLHFEGALRGAPPGTAPDGYAGVGIVVRADRVTLVGARVSGFRVGVHAAGVTGLVVDGADVSDNFRQRLGSTPDREDEADWLWPHDNDAREWFERYGAGIYVEDARRVVVRRSRARDVQNGLVLDRVSESLAYDNDFSFLSGWGIALWRSSRNVVSRNALDFCVRGYSHGVYNRGQDSAGLLMFEQCSENVVVENSITHGGDGVFAFAGQEALGARAGLPADFDHTGRGNDRNTFAYNDLSYAAAHGLELTFSFGNEVYGNRLVENAICGLWGGYSRDTLVTENLFVGNGEGAYGLERGGVNVEHGQEWLILRNRFEDNACGVHLWWDEDPHLADLPWTRANGFGSGDFALIGNEFVRDELAVQLRAAGPVVLAGNRFEGVGAQLEADDLSPVEILGDAQTSWEAPELPVFGSARPIGARERLVGRARIVLTAWGPYDWERPLLVRAPTPGDGTHRYRALQGAVSDARVTAGLELTVDGDQLSVRSAEPGLHPYELVATVGGVEQRASGVLADLGWRVTFVGWETDPREDPLAWREDAPARSAEVVLPVLDLPFGGRGPSDLVPDVPLSVGIGAEHFGLVAHAAPRLPAGRYRLRTLSDDGLRVTVDGQPLIDDWTHHAARAHEATFELESERTVTLLVEYFELTGGAQLRVEVEPVD